MPWTADKWDLFCALLNKGWPGEFDEDAAMVYRLLLDDVDPMAAADALKRLMYRGARFRPTPAEIIGAIVGTDAERPTFAQVLAIIRRVVPVRPDEAALERAEREHPYVAAFIRACGLSHLRTIPVDDPEYGELRKRELREEWEQFCARADERVSVGLALGASRREALERFDPLKGLDGIAPQPQLPRGADPLRAVPGGCRDCGASVTHQGRCDGCYEEWAARVLANEEAA